jgi:ferredoxin
MSSKLETYLDKFSEQEWLAAVNELLPSVHEVDKNAVQIWFRFFPLGLSRYLQSAEDRETAIREFAMLGNFDLSEQIDTSHHFLYGHRYWKVVKAAVKAEAAVFETAPASLAEEIRQIAQMVAEKIKVDASLVIGITAVGLMTLDQVGLEAFKNASGETEKPRGLMARKPDQIVRERAKDDSQGLLGFLKTVNRSFSVNYTGEHAEGKFKILDNEEIASAAARDRSENWRAQDDRCIEGVIPVECRSAACGTCWVGVLSGEEKLSEVKPRERRQMKVFGYNQPESEKPFIRLACQARANGNASIVIPPWNGVFGKAVYGNVETSVLEPATTSAKANREVVREVVKNDLL